MLRFGDEFSSASTSFYLIEIPDELIKSVESDPDATFHFKGRDDEDAVLVTEDKTFLVRRGETSNTQLIFACSASDLLGQNDQNCDEKSSGVSGNTDFEVAFTTGHTFELSHTAPRLKRLPEILSTYAYEGPDFDDEYNQKVSCRPTIDDLDLVLQSSRSEILLELQRLGALCLDGRYCLLDMSYESSLISRVFEACEEHGWWDGSGLALERLQSAPSLREFPAAILSNFLYKFGLKPPPGPGSPNTGNPAGILQRSGASAGLVELDLHKLAMARADELLATFGPSAGGGSGGIGRISVDEFLLAWAAALPAKAAGEARMESLRGRAIVEVRGSARLIRPLSPASLSPDPRTRFRQLFELAPSWTREDLLPYVADLAAQGAGGADQLLLKHTRVTRAGPPGSETRTYSARV